METAQDKVIAAANELFETNGKRPTLAELRAYLGGGSMTTISEAMKIWRKQIDARPSEVNTVSVPEDLTKKSNELIVSCWQTASTIANERLANERDALAQTRTEYETQLSEAEEIIAILESEKEEQRERNNELIKRLDQAEEALRTEKTQCHDKDVKIASLSSANDALSTTNTTLKKEKEELVAQLSTEHDKRLDAESRCKEMIADIERLAQELSDTKQDKNQQKLMSDQQLKEKNEELAVLHKKYEAQAVAYQQTIKETAQVQTDLAVALATNDLLSNQLNELNVMLKNELIKKSNDES